MKRLSYIVEPEKMFRFSMFGRASTKPYEGQIRGRSFHITRIINYRSSFLPLVDGVVERGIASATFIKVKMQLHVLTAIFLVVWCGAAGVCLIAFTIQAISEGKFNEAILASLGMLLFAYALTMGAFKYEANRTKKDLLDVFQAEIIDELP